MRADTLQPRAMRVIQVSQAGGPLELRERDIREPAADEVRVRVQACGVCHSDSYAKEGHFPGVSYPVVPGHEVAGVVDAIGDGVHGWNVGERVGVGWFGGNCGYCEPCRRGDLIDCQNKPIPGVTADGGYADYLVCRAGALARVPDDLPPEEAAPLMCAGVTTFNALRRSGARAGGLVAVLGIGGLGHLGVQFAVRLGFETVAIARGKEKEELARRLGAHHYVDSEAEDVAEALSRLGSAAAILATVTSASAMSAAFGVATRPVRQSAPTTANSRIRRGFIARSMGSPAATPRRRRPARWPRPAVARSARARPRARQRSARRTLSRILRAGVRSPPRGSKPRGRRGETPGRRRRRRPSGCACPARARCRRDRVDNPGRRAARDGCARGPERTRGSRRALAGA